MAIVIIALIFLEYFDAGKKEEHPIENPFPYDTFSRIHLTSTVSVTASSATYLESIATIRNFIHK
jgi:hypothetical protein